MIASIEPVNLLCDLIEASVGSLEARALPDRCGGSIDFLSKSAVTKGGLLSVLTCRACDGDHSVRLDSIRGRGAIGTFVPKPGASWWKTMSLLLFVSIP